MDLNNLNTENSQTYSIYYRYTKDLDPEPIPKELAMDKEASEKNIINEGDLKMAQQFIYTRSRTGKMVRIPRDQYQTWLKHQKNPDKKYLEKAEKELRNYLDTL